MSGPSESLPGVACLQDGVDHVRGARGAPLVVEYGDYLCPHSRDAFLAAREAEQLLSSGLRFAFRHFPLSLVHPHAMEASRSAEAAGRQGRFWEMSEALFEHQDVFATEGPRVLAAHLGLDLGAFDAARTSRAVLLRIRRDMAIGLASGQVGHTPTLFIDGVLHPGVCDTESLVAALGARAPAPAR